MDIVPNEMGVTNSVAFVPIFYPVLEHLSIHDYTRPRVVQEFTPDVIQGKPGFSVCSPGQKRVEGGIVTFVVEVGWRLAIRNDGYPGEDRRPLPDVINIRRLYGLLACLDIGDRCRALPVESRGDQHHGKIEHPLPFVGGGEPTLALFVPNIQRRNQSISSGVIALLCTMGQRRVGWLLDYIELTPCP